MSRKFSDFTNSNLKEFEQKNATAVENFKNQNQQDYEMLSSAINKYSNMNQSQLFNEFLKVANEKKRDGTLTFAYIDNIRKTIFPLISPEQQKIFNDLVDEIR